MSTMASHITSVSIVCSSVCSGAIQRIRPSSASLDFVRGIDRWPVNSPHKGPVTRIFFFNLMTSSCVCHRDHGRRKLSKGSKIIIRIKMDRIRVDIVTSLLDHQLGSQEKKWTLNPNTTLFCQENAFHNVDSKTVSVLFRLQCVNKRYVYTFDRKFLKSYN